MPQISRNMSRSQRVLELAREALLPEDQSAQPVTKTIWGSPAGKKRLAKRLVAMLPPHKTYVEPFVGSGAVLFAKEPADVEVINDADVEITQAFKLIKALTPEKLERLRRMQWSGDKATFKRLIDASPSEDAERLHRFLYLTHFSYGKMRGKSFSPSSQGIEARTVARIESHAPRLAKVRVHSGDYKAVVQKYDSSGTVFFLDPPYPGYDVDVGEGAFDEARFFEVLKEIKGKFLMTYGIRGELPKMLKGSGFHVRRIRTRRSISSMRGVGGSSVLTQLLVSNYILPRKALDADEPFELKVPLIKGVDPEDERFVLGVVLEPEVVDAQGDIYSAGEIRQAAHRFMEEFGGLGLQHHLKVNDQVRVLENYLAPGDFDLNGREVRKGTWLLAVRVRSDELWSQIRGGDLTGFSIGGSARRVPEKNDDDVTSEQAELTKADARKAPLNRVHRLLDMIVEEVSLVDRAANHHRFLIIKRDDAVDNFNDNDIDASFEVEESSTTEDSSPLSVAADALEALTGIVESLVDGTDPQDVNSSLQAIGQQLGAVAGGEEPEPEEPPGKNPANLQTVLETIQASLLQLQGSKSALSTQTSTPVPPPPPPPPVDGQLNAVLEGLKALTAAVRGQQQRIARVEKRFGLPNSQSAGERRRVAPPVAEESWPMDLNQPMDESSAVAETSFYNV